MGIVTLTWEPSPDDEHLSAWRSHVGEKTIFLYQLARQFERCPLNWSEAFAAIADHGLYQRLGVKVTGGKLNAKRRRHFLSRIKSRRRIPSRTISLAS
jgi:hypothetical protein